MMLWLEMEKEKSHFSEEVKLIGGEFAVYAETVCLFIFVHTHALNTCLIVLFGKSMYFHSTCTLCV